MNGKKYHAEIYGSVKVGEKGQVVIPKKLRELMGIHAGDSLIVIFGNGMLVGLAKHEKLIEAIELF